MGKRLFSLRPVVALGSAIAAAYIRLVYASSRVVRDPADTDARLFAQHPQIFAMWHGQFLMLPKIKPNRPADVAAMVARHGDAEIIGAVLKRFNMRLIRGAGAGKRRRNWGGATALREALTALGNGATVAMTADVPPGPARRAGEGIATLAQLSGRPVVPCAMATSRFIALSTWSKFTINLPFSTLAIVVGDPIRVGADAGPDRIEAGRAAIERGLAETTARAYALAGARDPLAPAPDDQTDRPSFTLAAYRALTRLAAPFAPLMLAWRTSRGKEERTRRPERYGVASLPRPPGFLAWFHAASVGEANAVLPVIEAIGREHPDVRVLLTTGTVTSAKLARARLPGTALHQYVPLDHQAYVQRFLDHWRPDLAVLVEFGDLAEPGAGDESARRPARARQRAHLPILVPQMAQAAGLEPAAVLRLQPRARPEREPRPALRHARGRRDARDRQPQGRCPAAARRCARRKAPRRRACRPACVAGSQHACGGG